MAGAGNLNGGNAGAEVAAALLEWEDGDRFSFEDSDRFEEDSLCSWSSEPESVCNNWRGWKKPNNNTSGSYNFTNGKKSADGESNNYGIALFPKSTTSFFFVFESMKFKPKSLLNLIRKKYPQKQ